MFLWKQLLAFHAVTLLVLEKSKLANGFMTLMFTEQHEPSVSPSKSSKFKADPMLARLDIDDADTRCLERE